MPRSATAEARWAQRSAALLAWLALGPGLAARCPVEHAGAFHELVGADVAASEALSQNLLGFTFGRAVLGDPRWRADASATDQEEQGRDQQQEQEEHRDSDQGKEGRGRRAFVDEWRAVVAEAAL